LLKLLVTKSPIPQYEELVIERCPQHIRDGRGVLPEPQPVNNDADDDGA
jgi:hypothetical protein